MVMTRVSGGRGHSRSPRLAITSKAAAAARAMGLSWLPAGRGTAPSGTPPRLLASRETSPFTASPSMRGVTDAVSAVPVRGNAWPDGPCVALGSTGSALPLLLAGALGCAFGDEPDESRRRLDLTLADQEQFGCPYSQLAQNGCSLFQFK